jgi:hypothetical protein
MKSALVVRGPSAATLETETRRCNGGAPGAGMTSGAALAAAEAKTTESKTKAAVATRLTFMASPIPKRA